MFNRREILKLFGFSAISSLLPWSTVNPYQDIDDRVDFNRGMLLTLASYGSKWEENSSILGLLKHLERNHGGKPQILNMDNYQSNASHTPSTRWKLIYERRRMVHNFCVLAQKNSEIRVATTSFFPKRWLSRDRKFFTGCTHELAYSSCVVLVARPGDKFYILKNRYGHVDRNVFEQLAS